MRGAYQMLASVNASKPAVHTLFNTGIEQCVDAGLLAVTLASIWYAPRINYISYGADAAVGTYGGNYQSADPFRLYNYIRYWDYLRIMHLGLLGTVVIIPFGLWPWLTRGRGWRSTRLGSWLLWGSVLSTYLVLSFLSQDGERNLTPMLPIFALLWADGLRGYPRRLAFTVGAVWVLALGCNGRFIPLTALTIFTTAPRRCGSKVNFWRARPAV